MSDLHNCGQKGIRAHAEDGLTKRGLSNVGQTLNRPPNTRLEDAQDSLRNEVESLGQTISHLESRLNPLLLPEETQKSLTAAGEPVRQCSSHLYALDCENLSIRRLRERLQAILHRLDI